MKKYEQVAHIVTDDKDEFLTRISARIDEFQQKGLEIEVQYQEKQFQSCALVLGYRITKEMKDI